MRSELITQALSWVMPDEAHHDVEQPDISTEDQRALDLFRTAVLNGPRDRASILVALNAALSRHKLAIVQMTGGRKYG